MKNNNIKEIIAELKNYSNKNKQQILAQSIQERLDQSLNSYYADLQKAFESIDYYNEKHNLSVVKKLNKG